VLPLAFSRLKQYLSEQSSATASGAASIALLNRALRKLRHFFIVTMICVPAASVGFIMILNDAHYDTTERAFPPVPERVQPGVTLPEWGLIVGQAWLCWYVCGVAAVHRSLSLSAHRFVAEPPHACDA
jgi:hypothetical protein